jgi:hypothetical protein
VALAPVAGVVAAGVVLLVVPAVLAAAAGIVDVELVEGLLLVFVPAPVVAVGVTGVVAYVDAPVLVVGVDTIVPFALTLAPTGYAGLLL